jgi:MoxR-like ATPase
MTHEKHEFLEDPDRWIADFRGGSGEQEVGDRRDGKFYRYTPEIKLAVRVALAVGRPLLVHGPSGCGKSSLVFNLARVLRRRYYEFVVHSRSEARDLYYRFDAVRRLGEAQLGSAGAAQGSLWRNTHAFIEPGPLWWVYAPESARRRGSLSNGVKPAVDSGRWPDDYLHPADRPESSVTAPAVLLIDEIDKADPDFPNNLLVPLGSREFIIEETGDLVKLEAETGPSNAPLIVITSNRERELPAAFVRRCVFLEIPPFTGDELIDLAKASFRNAQPEDIERWRRIIEMLGRVRRNNQVSPAEFLDTVRAIDLLKADDSKWESIIMRTSWTSSMSAGD